MKGVARKTFMKAPLISAMGVGILMGGITLFVSCSYDDPHRELALLLQRSPEELGPVDTQLVLDLEASVSAFFAEALNDGEVRLIGSLNQWHYQDYEVVANIFGREYKGRITLENAISVGGVADVTPEMLRVKKGDRVIALVHYNFGWSRGDEGSLMVTRTLADTPETRKRFAAALKALPTTFTAPLPAWAGENLEAVITPNLAAMHADGVTIERLRFRGCRVWIRRREPTEYHSMDRISVDTRPWSRYATVRYRRAKAPVSFQMCLSPDAKQVYMIFPDYDRLGRFGVGLAEFQKACLDPMPKDLSYYHPLTQTPFRIREMSFRVCDLATVVLAERELFRRGDETIEQWEKRIIAVVKSRPDKFDSQAPRPKSYAYNELSRLHGQAGLDLLRKIGATVDPLAAKYAVMYEAEVKE